MFTYIFFTWLNSVHFWKTEIISVRLF
jgi:hypothetical protein